MPTKTTPKRRTPTENAQLRRSLAWHALKSLAGREADRQALDVGDHHVLINVAVWVDKKSALSETIHARLIVNPDSKQAATSSPDADRVVAAILDAAGSHKKAVALVDAMLDRFRNAAALPEVDEKTQALAKRLNEGLRQTTTIGKRGAVRVERLADERA